MTSIPERLERSPLHQAVASPHNQMCMNWWFLHQRLEKEISVSLSSFIYVPHYHHTYAVLEVLPLMKVATTLDDVTSRVFKLVEDTSGDGVTS